MSRKPVFDAIREVRGKPFTVEEVANIDALLDKLDVANDADAGPATLKPSEACIKMMHRFEGCRLTAYPDPGSKDGHPWTIGYGATGPGIKRGVVWTQEQADARFRADVERFAQGVLELIDGEPTTQAQFDAMVSLAYNIGLVAFAGSTVLRKHAARDYEAAAKAFGLWVNNDGKRMQGLVNRRAAEAAHYRGRA